MRTRPFRAGRRSLAALATTALCALAIVAAPAHAQDALDAVDGRGAIRAMQRIGSSDGWVLTDAALLVTHDGGATWSDVAPDRAPGDLSDAFFLDGARGWLAAIDAKTPAGLLVLDTADGGRSWREQPLDASLLESDQPYASALVRFVDAEHGWVLGRVATSTAFSWGELVRTTDGGATWARMPQPPSAERFTFVDAQRGFLLGPGQGRVFASRDGGRSWQELALPALGRGESAVYDLPAFSTARDGRLAAHVRGAQPRLALYATHDGGRSWQSERALPLSADDAAELPAVAFAGGRLAAYATRGALVLAPESAARRLDLAAAGRTPAVRTLSFTHAGPAFALLADGTCDRHGCEQATRVLAIDTSARGGELARALLTRRESIAVPAAVPGPDGSTISTAYGFDKCDAASTGQMQTWKTYSNYLDANIYYGGTQRSCNPQTYLNAAWITTVFGQGWRLIPTWVGLQAPLYGGGAATFSTDPATARSQGLSEGSSATSTASSLGLGAGTPLYYDMENYNETNSTVTNAVRAFVNAWVERVKANGYIAGVYGNAYDIQHDMIPGVIANVPDAVWPASWYCNAGTSSCSWTPTVFGIPGLSDSYWTNNQRIRQYWGAHNQTFGGVTFNIDSDYSNAPVATSGGTPPYTFTCDDGQSCFVKYGPSAYWHTQTTCGGSSLGYSGDMVWTYVNGTVKSNYVRWTPTLSGAGNYTVSVFIPRCYGTSQQAKYVIYHNATTNTVTVNQNNAYDAWVTLGTYYFAGSGTQYVELADNTGESATSYRYLAFDAVKFSK